MGRQTVKIPKQFDPRATREKWYRFWLERGYFSAPVDGRNKPARSIVIPPPNVTGQLHIGHALNNTLQDVLVRYWRMCGHPTLWMPGTDHAGIATQAVVERELLATEGKTRHDLGRQAMLERIWQWRDKYGNRIIEQLQYMGCSCDWDRTRFTMDEGLSRAVRQVFVMLYEQGFIYRGHRLVNWDPKLRTAIADDEVEYEDRKGSLWYIRYPGADFDGEVLIATTRPETMFGDTAVAVNPSDQRYHHLVGKRVCLPLTERTIPIIADDVIDPAFGTGVLKVTPAHDQTDFEIGERHKLERINIFNPDATLNEHGGRYRGMDRYAARTAAVQELLQQGLLIRTEDYNNRVGVCYRSHCDIEPYLMQQWFVRMQPLMEEPIRAVREGRVRFVPKHFENLFFSWVDNVRDWCISRQIWWGHRIPVWYCAACGGQTCTMEDPTACGQCGSADIRQDEDVLDTWFSSALWPFSTMGWPELTPLLRMYYPTTTLITGFDIIYFWVARMILAGLKFMGDVPFHDVYITGLVRDLEGRKQSKSLGNAIDPVEVMEVYGVDAVRFTLCSLTSQGKDMKLGAETTADGHVAESRDNRLAGFRNFMNKIWNASRLLLSAVHERGAEGVRAVCMPSAGSPWEDRWIVSRLHATIAQVRQQLESYRYDLTCDALYDFIWKELCDWYLELIKSRLYSDDPAVRTVALSCALGVLEQTLRLLHPVAPFITEELYQTMKALDLLEEPAESCCIAPYPEPDASLRDEKIEAEMAFVQAVTSAIRNLRAELGMAPREKAELVIASDNGERMRCFERYAAAIVRLSNAAEEYAICGSAEGFPADTSVAVVGGLSFGVRMPAEVKAREIARLMRELEQAERLIVQTEAKLGNRQFIARAKPDVVAREREKLADTRQQREILRRRLAAIRGV